jgi:hypothetical protein
MKLISLFRMETTDFLTQKNLQDLFKDILFYHSSTYM